MHVHLRVGTRFVPDHGTIFNFPVSKYVSTLFKEKGISLGVSALRLASEAQEKWLEYPEYDLMQINVRTYLHSFLRPLFIKIYEEDSLFNWKANKTEIDKIFHPPDISLKERFYQLVQLFAKKQTRAIFKPTIGRIEFTRQEIDEHFDKLHSPSSQNIFYINLVLRSVFGRVLESIILLDRYLMLKEERDDSPFDTSLFPVFSPVISPRNMILVSTKNEVREK